ncbi:MAG: leucine-rich repeat domain-containing protein [Muribaculaceae bacterium]|nr:leucine-rich repeat domain-containing protein [Muribaculaceae bacterium]
MKKLLILTLLSALSLTANAYNFKVDGLYYSYAYADDECWLTRNPDDPYSGKVNIPATVSYEGKTYKVVSIIDWAFDGCEHLTSVTLPIGLRSINPSCFRGCSAIKEIIIPETVTSIGRAGFDSCTSLETVVLPGSLTDRLDPWTFANCTSLKNVTLGEGITQLPDHMFFNCISLEELVVPSTVERIEDQALGKCTSLRKIVIPDGLLYFGMNESCNSLQTIDFPESLTYFGGLPASGLISCTLPAGITEIIDGAFYFCNNLETIEVKGKLKSIGNRAFNYCVNLLSLPDFVYVETVGNEAFRFCDNLRSVTFSDKLKSICSDDEYSSLGYTFGSCKSLEHVELGNSVEEIPDWCFTGCSSLKTFHVPSHCKVIGNGAFNFCKSLEYVEMPERMESIGYAEPDEYRKGAFQECSSLESIIIPEGIRTLEEFTLAYCPSLKAVRLPSTLKNIECGALEDCGLTSLELPSGLEYLASRAITCDNLEELSVPKSVVRLGTAGSSSDWLSANNLKRLSFEDSKVKLDMQTGFHTNNLEEIYIGRDFEYGPEYRAWSHTLTKLSAGGYCTDITWFDPYPSRSLSEIEMSMITPPLTNEFYNNAYQSVTPVIDTLAYEAFSTAPIWKKFQKYELVEGFCKVQNVKEVDGIDFAQPYDIYVPDGKKVDSGIDSLPNGLYIVRQGNKTGKIIR